MDSLQSVLFLVVLLLFLYTPTKQAIHMFQQNRYQLPRYSSWLIQTIRYRYKQILALWVTLMATYGLYFVSRKDLPTILFILLLMIYSYVFYRVEDMKEYRKPLVFTHRVQRLLLAFYLLYLIVGTILLTKPLELWIFSIPYLYFMPWLMLLLVGLFMQPVETKIRQYFIRDARRILKEHRDLNIVGITGSYGKTSVKTILSTLLGDTYYTLMTPHSYNNLMGITLTIRSQLQQLHEVFLCEMGADHIHEIEQLMDFVHPNIGVVTAVGPQHLSTFHTMENILHEKMQMIEKLPADGIGVINGDNAYIRKYAIQNPCTIIRYGKRDDVDYRIEHMQYSQQGTTFDIRYQNECQRFSTRLLGEYNVLNITAGVAVAHTLGVPWEVLIKLVASLDYVEHRLQVRKGTHYTMIDNAYNSNPEGARCALEVLAQMEGKRIIVTPGFLDLGNKSEEAHIAFGKQIATHADEVILVGKQQTADIVKGLRESFFSLRCMHIVQGIDEAFALLDTLCDQNTTVLLENDLPDAFNH